MLSVISRGRYIVAAGVHFYPLPGAGNWKSAHDTKEAAEREEERLRSLIGGIGGGGLSNKRYDWVTIIDLAVELERLWVSP